MKRRAVPYRQRFEVAGLIHEFLTDYADAPFGTRRNHHDYLLGSFLPFLQAQGVTMLSEIDPPLIRRWLAAERSRVFVRRGVVHPLSPRSIAHRRASVRRFLEWCVEQEYLDQNAASRVKPPRLDKPTRMGFTAEESKKLVHEAGKSWGWLAARDRAIVTLLLGSGIRAGGLLGMSTKSIERRSLDGYKARFYVLEKGAKGRWLPLGMPSLRAIDEYLRVRSYESDMLWLTLQGKPMNYQGLHKMLSNLGKNAGIEDVSPHRFRHTFAAEFYTRHRDIKALKNRLGHTKISVTDEYLRSLGADYGLDGEYDSPDSWLT